MKLKLSSLFFILIAICIMIECNYEAFFPGFSSIMFFNTTYLSFVIQLLLFVFCLFNTNVKRRLNKYSSFINPFLLIVFVIVFIEMIYTVVYTELSISDVFNNSLIYFRVLLVFPLLYLLDYSGDKKVYNYVFSLVGIYLLYSAFICIVYNRSGVNLNPQIIYDEAYVRNSSIRIRSTSMTWFILLSSLFCFLKFTHKRIIYLLIAVFTSFYIFVFYQSRALDIAVVVMVSAMIVFRKRRSRRQVFMYLFLIVGILIFINSSVFRNFIFTFSTSYEDNTTSIRLIILEQINAAVNSLPLKYLFGCGIRNTVVVNGAVRYFMDLGLLGDILNTGILAIIMNVGLIIRCAKSYFFVKKHNATNSLFLLGLTAYLIVSLLGFSILPHNRIFVYPFVLALAEYYRTSAISENE